MLWMYTDVIPVYNYTTLRQRGLFLSRFLIGKTQGQRYHTSAVTVSQKDLRIYLLDNAYIMESGYGLTNHVFLLYDEYITQNKIYKVRPYKMLSPYTRVYVIIAISLP